MFKRWFSREDKMVSTPTVPEVMGLRLGGSFELDDLKMRLIEPTLIVEGIARTQIIQAVGVIKLDEDSTVLRYYTDDDGFLQLLLTGGMAEEHIADMKLWYFYETQSVSSDEDWDGLLQQTISQPSAHLEGHRFQRVWNGTGACTPPVAMTETTYLQDGKTHETDQFVMLYERSIEDESFEYMMHIGEEKLIHDRLDRCFVISTALDLQPADIDITG